LGIFKKIYETQKEIIKDVEEELKQGAEDIIDSVYTNQKLVAAELQEELMDKLRKQYEISVNKFFDILVSSLKKTGLLGVLAAAIITVKKDKVINNFIKKSWLLKQNLI